MRGGRDWVKNGDMWRVTRRHRDGALTVRHLDHGGKVRLPASYISEQVELAYASTVHRAQGSTVDTAHPLITSDMTREALYVASTRARRCTTVYVATEELLEPDAHHQPEPPREANQVLVGVLDRIGAEDSATALIRTTLDKATSLPYLIGRYDHARNLAAREALTITAQHALPDALARRILNDDSAQVLATALADATSRGADPGQVLRNAVAFDDLAPTESAALVLATRIQDFPSTLGIPRTAPAGRATSVAPLTHRRTPRLGRVPPQPRRRNRPTSPSTQVAPGCIPRAVPAARTPRHGPRRSATTRDTPTTRLQPRHRRRARRKVRSEMSTRAAPPRLFVAPHQRLLHHADSTTVPAALR